MSGDTIPNDLRDFILKHIDSIAQLEALLLLRREQQSSWDPDTVAQRLYIRPEEGAELLGRLASQGFLKLDGSTRYRYASHSPELQDMVDLLAEIYARQLIPITHLIHTKPKRIQEFADAFKFRKES